MMISKAILTAVVVISLTTVGSAGAQGNGDHPNRSDQPGSARSHGEAGNEAGFGAPPRSDGRQNNQQRSGGANAAHQSGRTNAAHQTNRFDGNRADNNGRSNDRGAGPNHEFRRGQRLPREYHNRQYVVDDWRGHHLSAPPRGYHWVQTGGDYVLVAIASGIIAQILFGTN